MDGATSAVARATPRHRSDPRSALRAARAGTPDRIQRPERRVQARETSAAWPIGARRSSPTYHSLPHCHMTTRSCAAHSKSATPRAAASSMARVAVAGALCGLLTLPLSAQVLRDSSATPDSLAIRLRRAEEAIAQLRQQLDEQASAGVTTRSRMQLELTGRVLVHGVRNDRRVDKTGEPQGGRPGCLSPPPTPGGMGARQTTLGAALSARAVLRGRFVPGR